MQKASLSCRVSAAGVVLIASAGLAQAPPTFRSLGWLPGGTSGSNASGVSADGSVVVGGGDSAAAARAFRWQGGIPASIGLPTGWTGATGRAVSGDGLTIVGGGGNFGGHGDAFRWTAAGGFQVLANLPKGFLAEATAVSHDGSAVAGTCVLETAATSPQRPVRWTAAGVQDLGSLPGGSVGEARGMSSDGSVVVGYSHTATTGMAFRWTESGGMAGLGVLPGDDASFAHAVSGDGLTVVGYSADAAPPAQVNHAMRWTAASGMQALPTLPGVVSSEALAASHDGSVIVGVAHWPFGAMESVVWTGAGMQRISTLLGPALPQGWKLTRADAVSADGTTVVGIAGTPCGPQAWVARLDGAPIPEVCYANCTGCSPSLTIADFACFQARYATGNPYADCNTDGTLTIADFGCFQTRFAAGCP